MLRTTISVMLLLSSAWTATAAESDTARPGWAPASADVFDTIADNSWYLRTEDGSARLYVTELGSGPLVVVLHGGAGSDFNYLVDAIKSEAATHRFVLFDQRGSVLSPVPRAAVKALTIDQLVADLETLRTSLGVEKMVLLGHSFGSLLAMRYYQQHPDHVASLVLTGSAPPSAPDGGMKALLAQSRQRAKMLMRRPVVAAVLRAEGLDVDPSALSPRQRSARDRIVGFADFDLIHVERWRQLQGGGVFYNGDVDDAIGDSMPSTYDIRPTLAKTPVYISILQGDSDYFDPAAASWSGIATKVSVIPNASHYAWIDNPRAFASSLHRALARADGNPPRR